MPKAHAPELREAALADLADMGVTDVAKKYGISPGTVSKWAKAAGVETISCEKNALAIEAIRHRVESRMWQIADEASARELQLLRSAGLRDVVGARTRAIHDAQLLGGGATNRTEHVDAVDAEIARLARDLADA